MKHAKYKTIGIIGGVGPLATADFLTKLLKLAQAPTDQDYPPVIAYSNSLIPDRTKALKGEGESPLEALKETGRTLFESGAEILCIPCNTAHAWIDEVQADLPVPVVSIIDACVNAIVTHHPQARRIGVLATSGTRMHGLYHRALSQAGLEPLHVNETMQAQVMQAIYGERGIKAGFINEARPLLEAAQQSLLDQGAEVIILGCTELPLVLEHGPVPYIDTSMELARAVLNASLRDQPTLHMPRQIPEAEPEPALG